MQKVFSLGHSPDPDDAFMFYAMAKGLIDLRGYHFEHILQDIQTLNERAMRAELDITAVSIHAFAYFADQYALLPSGASMGDGYGPMFVTVAETGWGEADPSRADWLRNRLIAVPGTMTSAYLTAKIFLGGDFRHIVVPFDEILQTVRDGRADVGLIIHEGQLTFSREGFHLVQDLGEWWKRTRGLPLPLGGNVVRKALPTKVKKDIKEILRESIAYGLAHRQSAIRHSMSHARGLDLPLADKFIGMYVNDLTLDYGELGQRAVSQLLGEAAAMGFIPRMPELEFA